MELLEKGVLEVRILHRFGLLSNGADTFFGLDEATMRMGFDYGLTDNLTIGVGRSTLNKELDAFFKFRPFPPGRWRIALFNSFNIGCYSTYHEMGRYYPQELFFFAYGLITTRLSLAVSSAMHSVCGLSLLWCIATIRCQCR